MFHLLPAISFSPLTPAVWFSCASITAVKLISLIFICQKSVYLFPAVKFISLLSQLSNCLRSHPSCQIPYLPIHLWNWFLSYPSYQMVFTGCPAVTVSRLPNCRPLTTPAAKKCSSHPSSQISSPLIPAVKLFFPFITAVKMISLIPQLLKFFPSYASCQIPSYSSCK